MAVRLHSWKTLTATILLVGGWTLPAGSVMAGFIAVSEQVGDAKIINTTESSAPSQPSVETTPNNNEQRPTPIPDPPRVFSELVFVSPVVSNIPERSVKEAVTFKIIAELAYAEVRQRTPGQNQGPKPYELVRPRDLGVPATQTLIQIHLSWKLTKEQVFIDLTSPCSRLFRPPRPLLA
jgi:hypothetical protein